MIELNEMLIDKYFGWLDSEDCLEEVKNLVTEYGAVIDPINGEMILGNTRLGIFANYHFKRDGED